MDTPFDPNKPEELAEHVASPSYPADGRPAARATDPMTSHAAANTARKAQTSIRVRVVALIGEHKALTADEVIHWFGLLGWAGSPSGIRSRLKEAEADGEIRICAELAESRLGNRARQYERVTETT